MRACGSFDGKALCSSKQRLHSVMIVMEEMTKESVDVMEGMMTAVMVITMVIGIFMVIFVFLRFSVIIILVMVVGLFREGVRGGRRLGHPHRWDASHGSRLRQARETK